MRTIQLKIPEIPGGISIKNSIAKFSKIANAIAKFGFNCFQKIQKDAVPFATEKFGK